MKKYRGPIILATTLILGVALAYQKFINSEPSDLPARGLASYSKSCVIKRATSDEYITKTYRYTDYQNQKQSFDYYSPVDVKNPPLVIYIHGGGWAKGRKHGKQGKRLAKAILAMGFAYASFDYPLVDIENEKNLFPAAPATLRCGLRYLNKKSRKLGFNRKRVAIIGTSAGANLASLIAYAPEDSRFFDKHYTCEHEDSRMIPLQANIAFYGLHDLNDRSVRRLSFVENYLQGGSRRLSERASPVSYVNSDSPATLIVHGTNDETVPYIQSELLHEVLEEFNIYSKLALIEGAPHGFSPFTFKEKKSFDNSISNCKLKNFLKRFLTEPATDG